jgi:hypothetical protein
MGAHEDVRQVGWDFQARADRREVNTRGQTPEYRSHLCLIFLWPSTVHILESKWRFAIPPLNGVLASYIKHSGFGTDVSTTTAQRVPGERSKLQEDLCACVRGV